QFPVHKEVDALPLPPPPPPPPPAPGRNLITSEDSQAFNDFLQKIGSDQNVDEEDLQDPFTGRKAAAGYDNWASDLPPTLRRDVTCLPSARTNPREASILQPLAFDGGFINHGHVHEANVPQHVAPTAIMYSGGSVQRHMPDLGLLPAGSPDYHQYFPWEHVVGTDIPAGSDARLFAEVPPKDTSSSRSITHANQAMQSLSTCETQQELSYGSDPCFKANHFVAPADEIIAQRIDSGLLSRFDRLISQESADSTRSPSPQIEEPEPSVSSPSMAPRAITVESPVTTIVRKCPPPKRKLSTVDGQRCVPQLTSPTLQPKQKRGPKPKSTGRQGAICQTEPRVLQSEEENRKKHNEGEQKRRNRATDAWNAFAETVPGLSDRRSKIADVMYAQRWFQRMLDENERMEKHLHAFAAKKSSVDGEGQ
ncbi:MAG: hypothetical protein Q9173_001708, partial [Seirophora scorigena]